MVLLIVTIQMTWDNGSSLGLIVCVDKFKVVGKKDLDNNIKI